MTKTTFGVAALAAALLLALSPEARKTARKYAVKGTETLLDWTDQFKEVTAGLKNQARNDNHSIERHNGEF